MTSKILKSEQSYVRLLDDQGVAYGSGNKLYVDAAISSAVVEVSGSALTYLQGIDTDTGSIDGKLPALDGGHVPVTVKNTSLATTNAGTFAVQEDGAALTALQAIETDTGAIDGKLPALDGGYVPVNVKNTVSVTQAAQDASLGVVWNNVSTGAGGFSASRHVAGPLVTCFGSCSGSTTLYLQYSSDNSTWYRSNTSAILSGSVPPFEITLSTAAPYVRLESSTDVSATAYISSR